MKKPKKEDLLDPAKNSPKEIVEKFILVNGQKNRHERRYLQKVTGVKIIGRNIPEFKK